ncbi:MAG: hypothetical protein MRECE_19c013 [Mycoplasmataceae bacterium CE_OT135]|nr:MAG: hypothetical protein MRECE_19c013 [Mycoplasmataceae bacterium CE_OT135]
MFPLFQPFLSTGTIIGLTGGEEGGVEVWLLCSRGFFRSEGFTPFFTLSKSSFCKLSLFMVILFPF